MNKFKKGDRVLILDPARSIQDWGGDEPKTYAWKNRVVCTVDFYEVDGTEKRVYIKIPTHRSHVWSIHEDDLIRHRKPTILIRSKYA